MIMHLLFLISFIVSICSQEYVNLHNSARRQAGVYTNLARSYNLERSAQRVAQWLCNTGKWEHSRKSSSGTAPGYRPYSTGENLGGHGNIPASVNAFIAEKQYWRNGRCQSGKICGHYTQVISRNAGSVGCYAQKCPGGGMAGRVACHYASGNRMEVDVNAENCGEEYYDGDMCLYADDKVMRFSVEQEDGCEFEHKIYKHTDAAYNKFFLHYHPIEADDNSTETEDRWLVSRDYVSDIALFWCDSDSLMECLEGRWSKNIFAELGVSEAIDDGITIKQCPYEAKVEEEETNPAVLFIVLGALGVIVIAGLIYFVVRSQRSSKAIKHLELKDEDETLEVDHEVNQTTV